MQHAAEPWAVPDLFTINDEPIERMHSRTQSEPGPDVGHQVVLVSHNCEARTPAEPHCECLCIQCKGRPYNKFHMQQDAVMLEQTS